MLRIRLALASLIVLLATAPAAASCFTTSPPNFTMPCYTDPITCLDELSRHGGTLQARIDIAGSFRQAAGSGASLDGSLELDASGAALATVRLPAGALAATGSDVSVADDGELRLTLTAEGRPASLGRDGTVVRGNLHGTPHPLLPVESGSFAASADGVTGTVVGSVWDGAGPLFEFAGAVISADEIVARTTATTRERGSGREIVAHGLTVLVRDGPAARRRCSARCPPRLASAA